MKYTDKKSIYHLARPFRRKSTKESTRRHKSRLFGQNISQPNSFDSQDPMINTMDNSSYKSRHLQEQFNNPTDTPIIRPIVLNQISRVNSGAKQVPDQVIIEKPISIDIDQVGQFTMICTPADLKALVIGFMFSEGMIGSIEDVVSISEPDNNETAMMTAQIKNPDVAQAQKNLVITSSCGLCGNNKVDDLLQSIPSCQHTLQFSSSHIMYLIDQLYASQQAFHLTGGSHAAGIFTPDGNIFAFCEDIGRHNAFDKTIGKALIEQKTLKGCGVTLSGRVSFEMVAKAARAGIELIIAVSAPSSLAIDAADKWGITLCGFVRSTRANIYTHPDRLLNTA